MAQISTYKQATMGLGFWLKKQRKTAKLLTNFPSTNPETQVSEKAKKILETKGVFKLEYSGSLQDINQGFWKKIGDPFWPSAAECKEEEGEEKNLKIQGGF